MLEHTRTQLGQGMPIVRESCDVGEICDAALEEMKSSQPDRAFCLATSGALGGFFDRARLEQAFANLLNNAVQHGARTRQWFWRPTARRFRRTRCT